MSFAENEVTEEETAQVFEVLDNPTDYLSKDTKELILQEADLPVSFDLRNVDTDGDGTGDRCYVTPVRAQYPFGTCWGFAAIAAAETNILSTLLDNDPDAWKTLDLSEKHLAYFSHIWLDDPESPQNGEGMYNPKSEDLNDYTAADIYDVGGNCFLAANTFATGIGPTLESRDEAFLYKGNPGSIQEAYEADGIMYPRSYSKNDDWKMDESYRYLQDYVLANSCILPSPALYSSMSTQYTYNPAGTIAIKENLLKKNAVVIGFHADLSRPWQTAAEGEYMNARTWAHYTWDYQSANHAVTIIGWDDNYSRTNFPTEHQPPEDGAWLVKNSWGSGENEFPNMGSGTWGIPVPKKDAGGNIITDENGDPVMVGSGYFWLSYYDQSIYTPEVLQFDPWLKGEGTKYDPNTLHRDQHDLMPVTRIMETISPDPVMTANVFAPKKTEHVMNIAYEVATPGTRVDYEIYLLAPEASSPDDGILMASGSKTYPYGGYYQEYLDEPLVVHAGQRYSIVVMETLEDGKYGVNTPTAFGKNIYLSYAKAVVNMGESYLNVNGTWLDWSAEEPRAIIFADTWENAKDGIAFDNFPIKGIAYDSPLDVGVRLADPNVTKVDLEAGSSVTLELELFGSDVGLLDDEYNTVEWKTAGDNAQYITVTPSADGLKATVSGSINGTAYVAATVKEVGTVLIPVTVYGEVSIAGANVVPNASQLTYNGQVRKPVIKTIGGMALREGTDYTVKWSNDSSKNAGTYTATITGQGKYTGTTTLTYQITKASNTMKAKGRTVKLKASSLQNKSAVIKRAKALKISKAQGNVKYKLAKVSQKKYRNYFKINKKTGQVTVKKGLPQGTYKLTVKATAAGNKNYKKLTSKATVTIKVY